jgi:predicted DNA-binding transcriptional regulator YafY
MREVRALASHFTRPKRFDLAAVWRDEVARFEASLRREKALIRVSPSAMWSIDRLGADALEAITAEKPDERGWRKAAIWIESVPHAASLLLGFGVSIEVLEPEALRAELLARARQVCRYYEVHPAK